MNVLLNDTGGQISWTQTNRYRRLVDQGRVSVNPTLPLMVKLQGLNTASTVDLSTLTTRIEGDDTIHILTLDDIPPPVTVLNVVNGVPYRIGLSIDGGPIYISGDAVLDVVSPGTDALMRFHYPDDKLSDELEVPVGDRVSVMIVVAAQLNSQVAGTLIEPNSPIGEPVYAYTIDATNRLTQTRMIRSGDSYVYVLDSDAPGLGFFQSSPPEFWSYDGPVEGGGVTGTPLSPSQVGVVKRQRTEATDTTTVTPPPDDANRSYLFWFILAGIGLIALIGLIAIVYKVATKSDQTVVAVDEDYAGADAFTDSILY